MQKLKVEYMRLEKIKPYESNPRKNTDKAVKIVAESIENFGFKNPIIIDENNVIIAGHTRYKAAKKLKLAEVPVIRATDLNEQQVRAFRIADNKTTEFSEWDEELLFKELQLLDEMFTGFAANEIKELADLLSEMEDEVVVEDEFDDSGMHDDNYIPFTKHGQIWQLGRHRLMCGDSTLKENVAKLMNGVKANLLITDPPYNVSYEGKTKDALTIQNDSMDNDTFRKFLRDAFSAADSVMEPGAVFYIWHADSEGYNFRGACFDIGWQVRQCLIWVKNSMVLGRQDYQWKHEPCLYGWKSGASHYWGNNRKQTTVLEFDRPTRNAEHPTMKPVLLFDYQIKNSSKHGDNVLDLFGGSGTTLIACEQNGRNAFLMELDERYCDVIIKRWEEFTGEKAVLLNNNRH